jgi:hypothetical protein
MKNAVFWEERIASIIRVTIIRELGNMFLHGPHGFTSQKAVFFIVPAVKTSNLI